MKSASEIVALVRGFEECTLPKAEWTHHAHLTVALCYLRHLEREEATTRLREGIQHYNRTAGGSPHGYHESITLAWVAVLTRFLAEHDRGQSQAELTRLLIAECGDKDYLLRYYSRAVLLSDAARHGWVPPDLQPIERG